ncbi:uncharacterized protein [Eurosta solidaginis]|uniref:uncharacterized protein isoform X2 n=1 Tax=Eurosta solidaginis TaxID=178769 RepID=UPI0035309E99
MAIQIDSSRDCSSIFIQIFQTQKVIIANQQKIERRLHALETTFEENAVDKVALMAQNKCIRECKVLVSKVLSGVSRLTQKLDDEEAKALKSDKPNDPVAVPENFQYMGLPMDELQIEISASFPMASIDAIKDFEEKLEQKEYVNAMALYLNQLKGSNGTLDKVFRKVMTDDLIFAFNYDGRNTKRALSKLKLINHVLYGVFSEEGRDQFEKAIRKSVDMSHNRMHQKKFQKNKNPSGSVTVKTGKKRRQSESSM